MFRFRFQIRISGNGDEENNSGSFPPNESLRLVLEPDNIHGKILFRDLYYSAFHLTISIIILI